MRLITASLAVLLVSPSSAISFDCRDIVREKVRWNFEKLGGQHQVSWIEHHANVIRNITFKIDICNALVLPDAAEKKDCNLGTRICAIEHEIDTDKNDRYIGAWPISRDYAPESVSIEPKITRLKKENQEGEQNTQEGVEIELKGGMDNKVRQKADITFLCDKEPKETRRRSLATRDDEEDGDDGNKHDGKEWEAAKKTSDGVGGTIEFVAFKDAILELEWTTPYACEDAISMPDKDKEPSSDDGSNNTKRWGFFSWFFFLIFLLLAGFLIFTAWVNYSRNGARGCDLLPFSDTLRDLPYILGDWSRKIASTLGGSGTRGGYSAV